MFFDACGNRKYLKSQTLRPGGKITLRQRPPFQDHQKIVGQSSQGRQLTSGHLINHFSEGLISKVFPKTRERGLVFVEGNYLLSRLSSESCKRPKKIRPCDDLHQRVELT